MKEIEPLCFNCRTTKLTDSYKQFGARALVIQPTAGFPCYVFQPLSNWNRYKLGEETQELQKKKGSWNESMSPEGRTVILAITR